MNRESLGFYIFRWFVAIAVFVLMAMLYWSSLLVEEEVLNVQSSLNSIRNDISILREQIHHIESRPPSPTPSTLQAPISDSSQANLLEEDPFYTTTLPSLLPPQFHPSGLFRQATVGRPADLHPFSNWQNVSSWRDQCSLSLAKQQFGKYESMAPDMATRIEMRHRASDGAVEYWIFLRDNVYWQPLSPEMFSESVHMAPHFLKRHQVTAHDFKFYVDAIMNPYVQQPGAVAMRTYLNDLEEIRVVDDLTLVVRWKTKDLIESDGSHVYKAKYVSKQITGGIKPLASFVYQYFPDGKKILDEDKDPETYRTNSVWAQNFSQHWARNIIPSCGPWIFQQMTDREIRFKRNPDYYQPLAVLIGESVEEFKEAPDAIWQDFKADKIDVYPLQPDQQIELSRFMSSSQYDKQKNKDHTINQIDYIGRSYAYIGWNSTNPLFKSKKIRQALTLAIDRERIVQQYLNGQGILINGPFYPYSPNYDKTLSPWPFDLDAAKRLLRQEGWYDSNDDGVIDKEIDGKRVSFQFTLTYFVKNPTTKAVVEYISTSLKELGIVCHLNGVDIADLSAVFDQKNFDAIVLGWSLGTPPEDLRQLWSSAGAKEAGSSNAIGFVNAEVDEIINKLEYEYDAQERIKLYHRFNRIIFDECPYTFLYTPKAKLLYRSYVQNVWIPADRQDLVPGADVAEPDSSIFWIKKHD